MPRSKQKGSYEMVRACVPATKRVLHVIRRIAEKRGLSVSQTVEALATDWVTECVPAREHVKWLGRDC
jgi:hypothetical protein